MRRLMSPAERKQRKVAREEAQEIEDVEALGDYVGVLELQLFDSIPDLEPGNVPAYIRAVNKCLLHQIIDANRAKILLYGAQLFMAAAPQVLPPVSAPEPVHRSRPDRRFKQREEQQTWTITPDQAARLTSSSESKEP